MEPSAEATLTENNQPDVIQLRDMDGVATTVDEWLAEIAQAAIVEITSVRVEETTQGITLRLETNGELSAPATSVSGNAVIAEIPNTVLRLSEGDEFSASAPAEGIALVNVTSLPDNRVRIAIAGTDAPPVVDIRTGASGITVSATPREPTAAPEPDEEIEIVVTGEKDEDRYFVPDASTATRTDTPILDTPASIQVIPRQVLEDQQVIRLEEALRNVSGISVGASNEGQGVFIDIRGFQGAPVLLDGFRQYGQGGYQSILETANLEQIEVLKGPASILYGEIQPGGVSDILPY